LGEFSPIVRLFTLGSFLKITKVAKMFGQLFFTVHTFLTKNVWASFGAIFLVTLPTNVWTYLGDSYATICHT
jgi:hypothetical protein